MCDTRDRIWELKKFSILMVFCSLADPMNLNKRKIHLRWIPEGGRSQALPLIATGRGKQEETYPASPTGAKNIFSLPTIAPANMKLTSQNSLSSSCSKQPLPNFSFFSINSSPLFTRFAYGFAIAYTFQIAALLLFLNK